MENEQIRKVMGQAVSLNHLDETLYHELEGWGVFFSCPISLMDCKDKEYLCAILRMKDDMYAGCAIFFKEGETAHFLHLELIPSVRNNRLGEALFSQAITLLRAEGISRILANDTLDERKNRYLQTLGLSSDFSACYLEYDYYAITNSLLYSQLSKLGNLIKNVKDGSEISEQSKADFLHSLLKKGERIREDLFYDKYSLFYTNKDEIYGYIGIHMQNEDTICVMDKGLLIDKIDRIDIRLPLFGKLLYFADKFVEHKERFKLLFIIDDPQIKNGMLRSIGLPNLQTEISTYALNL